MKLPLSYYQRENVVEIAKDLLGKKLFTKIDHQLCAGTIVETEAYNGIYDRASHSFNGKYTERTKVLYEDGGVTYIYLCYGMHYLLNVVTNKKNVPSGILIRALEPILGIQTMLKRKNKAAMDYSLTKGPGALCKALGITKAVNNTKLISPSIWIEDSPPVNDSDILVGPRVGVDYAKEDKFLPYRFRIKNNKWTS